MLYRNLTGLENLEYFSALAGRRRLHARGTARPFRIASDLQADAAHRRVGTYSKGMRQKVGTVVFFRVVSQDSAGNLAWTEERSATIPPGIESLSVAQVDSDIQITVRFNASVEAPTLLFGAAGGPLGSSAAFELQDDGSYVATIPSPADPQALAFQIQWQSNGQTLRSGVATLEAGGEHDAVAGIVAIPLPQVGAASATASWCSSTACATPPRSASTTTCSSIRS